MHFKAKVTRIEALAHMLNLASVVFFFISSSSSFLQLPASFHIEST